MRRSAVTIFGQGPTGRWIAVGRARIGRRTGRVVALVELDAVPLTGRLCLPMADLQVLAQDEAQRRAARPAKRRGVAEHDQPQPPAVRKGPLGGVVLLLAAALSSCAGLPPRASWAASGCVPARSTDPQVTQQMCTGVRDTSFFSCVVQPWHAITCTATTCSDDQTAAGVQGRS